MIRRLAPEAIRARKYNGERIVALTAYDYPTAKILDEAGIDIILVGDSLGMTVLGYPDTTQVKLEDMVYHTRAVARGISTSLLAADMPFQTYVNPDQAVETAKRLTAAGAAAVKLEGGQSCYQQIRAITKNGVPFIGHIGMLPQHVIEEGGYRMKGRTSEERSFLKEEALAVQEGGAFALVLELVEPGVASEITQMLSIPTIGIGSGTCCDGQILVFHDLVGYFPWFKPKHVKPEANLAASIRDAANAFIRRVRLPSSGAGE
jgi:3-methyl-2-oxobutanoate hydroxymethyltransferase